MTTPPYTRERDVAIAAVRAAARLCQDVQQELSASALEKEDRTPVTIADYGSQALIARMLRASFPTDPIMAEEDAAALRESAQAEMTQQLTSYVQRIHPQATTEDIFSWIDYGNLDTYADRFWTLDPIDGTKGFLRGDQYAIALALIEDGEVQVAALACPNLPHVWEAPRDEGWAFIAVRGEGAVRLPLATDAATETPIGVSTTQDPAEARFCESVVSAHSSHEAAQAIADHLGIEREPLRVDSQCKYAIVARGEAEIYLRLPRPGTSYIERIWDHAAGMLVVEEAGGTVTDLDGRPLDFTRGKKLHGNRGIVATNGLLHADVREALQATDAA